MKPRIVLDTNALISAVLFERGNEAGILAYALQGKVTLLASLEILEEYRETLSRPKFKLTQVEILTAFQMIISLSEIVLRTRKAPARCRDPDDQKFLDYATTARANYLITGDSDLLAIAHVERTKIVPAGMLVQRLEREN